MEIPPEKCRPRSSRRMRWKRAPGHRKKKQRSKVWRAKVEITRLRESIKDLEGLLDLLRSQHREERRGLDCSRSNKAGVLMWKGVATRKFHRLRQSQAENERLRDQIATQIGFVKIMLRLVHRAATGMTTTTAAHRPPETGEELVARVRCELFARAAAQYASVADVVGDKWFSRKSVDGGVRQATMHRQNNKIISPGCTLVTSRFAMAVPLSAVAVTKAVWSGEYDMRPNETRVVRSKRHEGQHFFFHS